MNENRKSNLGGVDIKLETPEYEHAKEGTVVLSGPGGDQSVAIHPTSRTFRTTDLVPGEYEIRASSIVYGRSTTRLFVREGDVTRTTLRLDGNPVKGKTSVSIAVSGLSSEKKEVRVRATDKLTGEIVFHDAVKVNKGYIVVKDIPFGKIHWDFEDNGATSCYDSEVNDDSDFHIPNIRLIPRIPLIVDPPDWNFKDLPVHLHETLRLLPRIGIESIEDLAVVEPEDLMHRVKNADWNEGSDIPSRLLAQAVESARTHLGVRSFSGEERSAFRLAESDTFFRAFKPRIAGIAEIAVNLGAGSEGKVVIERPDGTEEIYDAVDNIRLPVVESEIKSEKSFKVSVRNISDKPAFGAISVRLPIDERIHGFVADTFSVKAQIEGILKGLAVRNPGISTLVPDAIMAPENITMWLDRARTFMNKAGVCSINDLGKFRVKPMPILNAGVYVSPIARPANLSEVPVLKHYAFQRFLAEGILQYRPNDVLHDTAVIMAGEWDIRDQTITIGKEVKELLVIARKINHNTNSKINWEQCPLSGPRTYWPQTANSASNGASPGARCGDGENGDPNPHPSRNGGTDATAEGPIVTMYILDATNNLPIIDLQGQKGGIGGIGQNGGNGGHGSQGEHADGTFFGGCCRDAGFGGNGGNGGKGGTGGKGGAITILTTAQSITVLNASRPDINVNPGDGGDPGGPGNPGQGGNGGPAGTADCEPWCDDLPERKGNSGSVGAIGVEGLPGDPGPKVLEDAIQFLPITEEQWINNLNNPHILSVNPLEVEPGQTVQITGHNFNPTVDRVYFDGANIASVTNATQASFVVPLDAEGGLHPVVIRPAEVTNRRSNRVMLHVIPKLDVIPAGTRWEDNSSITLTGMAFQPGLQVIAEDRSVTPVQNFSIPVVGVTRTSINIQIPGGNLSGLNGVRRIVISNPSGGMSRDERIARIGSKIVIRCAAFRVVGTTPGVGTSRSEADIANLFNDAFPQNINIPWAAANISFKLSQPVQTITVSDNDANLWPSDDLSKDRAIYNNAPAVAGALNFFFLRDIDLSTAYSYFGGGPLFIADEGKQVLGSVDFQQVVAHEIGHSLCLRHVCDLFGEGPGTFFNRACEEDDEAFLMYPSWDASNGMAILPGQIGPARIGATHFEVGKTAFLPAASLFNQNNTVPQCLATDNLN